MPRRTLHLTILCSSQLLCPHVSKGGGEFGDSLRLSGGCGELASRQRASMALGDCTAYPKLCVLWFDSVLMAVQSLRTGFVRGEVGAPFPVCVAAKQKLGRCCFSTSLQVPRDSRQGRDSRLVRYPLCASSLPQNPPRFPPAEIISREETVEEGKPYLVWKGNGLLKWSGK